MTKPKLAQQFFEIRYERGYRYLDRCGEVMLILEELLPSETQKVWMPEEINPSGARLKCPDLDVGVVFDSYRLLISQTPANHPEDFAAIAKIVFATMSARFDIRSALRMGHRSLYLIGTDSVADAEKLSVRLSPFNGWPVKPVDGMNTTACEATVVVENENGSGYRLSLMPTSKVEAPLQIDPRLRMAPRLRNTDQDKALIDQLRRQAQREKDPVAGVLIDVDYYWVRPSQPNVEAFLVEKRAGGGTPIWRGLAAESLMTEFESLVGSATSAGKEGFSSLRAPAYTDSVPVARKPIEGSYSGTGTAIGTPKFEPTLSRVRGTGQLDRVLLERATEVLEGIESAPPEIAALAIESLRCVCSELWTGASTASPPHQSLLAAVEAFVRSLDQISASQASALRGAFTDLAQPRLTAQFVEIVASRLIDEGYNPLAPLSAMEDEDGGTAGQY